MGLSLSLSLPPPSPLNPPRPPRAAHLEDGEHAARADVLAVEEAERVGF